MPPSFLIYKRLLTTMMRIPTRKKKKILVRTIRYIDEWLLIFKNQEPFILSDVDEHELRPPAPFNDIDNEILEDLQGLADRLRNRYRPRSYPTLDPDNVIAMHPTMQDADLWMIKTNVRMLSFTHLVAYSSVSPDRRLPSSSS